MTCYCGEQKSDYLFSAGNFEIARCIGCGQVRTISRGRIPLKQAYDKTDICIYIEKEKEFRRLFRELIQFIQQYRNRGIMVDIGAGVGLLVSEAQKAGFEAYGFEPSKPSVDMAKKRFGVTLSAFEFNSKSIVSPVDIVVINHVLEHIVEPKKLLMHVKKILKRNGYLFIGVPNIGNFIAQLKKARWQSLIPEQHRWHFTGQTLDQLVGQCGFTRVGCKSDNHDRSMHPAWKKPFYALHDWMTSRTCCGEAILVAYKKI